MSEGADKYFGSAVAHASASVLDPARWHDCVASIAALTDSAGAALFRPSLAIPDPNLGTAGTYGAGAVPYFAYWIQRDPWNPILAREGKFRHAGEVLVGEQILPGREFRRTEYFQEHARRYDSGHKMFAKVFGAGDAHHPATHLTLNRGFGQADFAAEQAGYVRRLLPALRQALEARRALDSPGVAAGDPSTAALAALSHPCLVIADDRRIEYANAGAIAAAGREGWLGVRLGRLHRLGDADADVIEKRLFDAAHGRGGRLAVAFRGGTESLDPVRAVCHVVPMRDSGLARSWPRGIALLVISVTPTDEEDRDWIHGPLARQYRLTTTECRVLTLLTRGDEVPTIAARMRIAPLTVRVHLRSLREKTGRRSQVQLVRLGLGR